MKQNVVISISDVNKIEFSALPLAMHLQSMHNVASMCYWRFYIPTGKKQCLVFSTWKGVNLSSKMLNSDSAKNLPHIFCSIFTISLGSKTVFFFFFSGLYKETCISNTKREGAYESYIIIDIASNGWYAMNCWVHLKINKIKIIAKHSEVYYMIFNFESW